MFASLEWPVDASLSHLATDVARVCDAASTAPSTDRVDAIVRMLQDADTLIAGAVALLSRGGIDAVRGLTTEMVLMLEARRTGSEARFLMQASATLKEMPRLAAAFDAKIISWGQVRAIVSAVTRVKAANRVEIDAIINQQAPAMRNADPERLIELIDHEVARRRPDTMLTREDRTVASSFLSVQGRLDGSASIYVEADPESAATIVEALDAVADAPNHPDDGPSRASQRFDALVAICETSLTGQTSSTTLRPRPRLHATFNIAGLTDAARDQGIQLLWSIAGRNPRLTHVARETLLCDATIIPVIFDGPNPIQVGNAHNTFSNKTRTAIAVRDRHCRFCNRAPVNWCDAHHLQPSIGNTANDGCLLCRRCHRRVHRYKWKLTLRNDGIIQFRRQGQTFLSMPP